MSLQNYWSVRTEVPRPQLFSNSFWCPFLDSCSPAIPLPPLCFIKHTTPFHSQNGKGFQAVFHWINNFYNFPINWALEENSGSPSKISFAPNHYISQHLPPICETPDIHQTHVLMTFGVLFWAGVIHFLGQQGTACVLRIQTSAFLLLYNFQFHLTGPLMVCFTRKHKGRNFRCWPIIVQEVCMAKENTVYFTFWFDYYGKIFLCCYIPSH